MNSGDVQVHLIEFSFYRNYDFMIVCCSRDVIGTEVYICHPNRGNRRDCWRKSHGARKSTGHDRRRLNKKLKIQPSPQSKKMKPARECRRIRLNPIFSDQGF